MLVQYLYSQGDLLEKRNTYFYTAFQGRAFLKSWAESRDQILGSLPAPAIHMPDVDFAIARRGEQGGETEVLLERTLIGIKDPGDSVGRSLLEKFLNRFEITKRVYEAYLPNFRARPGSSYRCLGLYLRIGELFEMAYRVTGDLRYLNVLMKCVDTLSAYRTELGSEGGARLARLIFKERGYIGSLMPGEGLTPCI